MFIFENYEQRNLCCTTHDLQLHGYIHMYKCTYIWFARCTLINESYRVFIALIEYYIYIYMFVYIMMRSTVRIGKELSEWFIPKKRSRQSDNLSCDFFNLELSVQLLVVIVGLKTTKWMGALNICISSVLVTLLPRQSWQL